ncbi:hypothetical protein [Streptomyces sp. NPDC058664]|uniref:hypothetical protein n=1 Tax=unclassified Streptomyces TaxID=2593676 RepID=UPI0036688434
MLTWDLGERLVGCRPKRTHLDALQATASAGISSPVIKWTAWGKDFEAAHASLDDIATLVGQRPIKQLELQVSDATTPHSPVATVTFGDRRGRGRQFFLGVFMTYDRSWDTRLQVRHSTRTTAEDKLHQLALVLRRTQVLWKYTKLITLVSMLWQTAFLWMLLRWVGTWDFPSPADAVAFVLTAAVVLSIPHMAADVLLSFRVQVAPAPTGWWNQLVSNPNLNTALGAVFGLLSLIVAVAVAIKEFAGGS